MTDRIGQQLGNYRLERLLGQGGFADVYLGKHIHLDTQAALKVRHTQLIHEDIEKFRHEARTIAHLDHPHIVRVLEFGVEGATPFLVMNYAPNGSLRQLHPRGTRLPLSTVVAYVKQVAEALQYAHQQKLIHRDVKPENMLLGRNNEVLLSDFGFVLVAQSSASQTTKETAGTILYMAPEQLQGKPRPASDQYALGVVVYEWLTGERPFRGSAMEVATQHMFIPPPPLREQNPAVPPDVEEVVLTALSKDPQQRFASVRAFAQALEQASHSEAAALAGQETVNERSTSSASEPEDPASKTVPEWSAPDNERQLVAATSASRQAAAVRQSIPPPLPLQRTPLIGRTQEVEAVCSLLSRAEVRLLTLTGTGGIGKTRLALAVAAASQDVFADGACFVPLAPLSDPALVGTTIAHTLGLPEIGGRAPLDLLKAALQTKRLLLLLDNFEHVLSAASQLSDLLSACPQLTLLVTSRAVLHVYGEQEYAVPPLSLPDLTQLPGREALSQYAAVALFLARAQAVKPDFQLTPMNARVLVEICTRLDGLPLAIELAAARVKLLSPEALLGRLGQRLAVLTQGPRDAPERQQTLRKTLTWSYDLLSEAEQRLFRRLAVFVGGCPLEAVEAVCKMLDGEEGTVLEGVSSLMDQSLLHQAQLEQEEPRLVMLETIREYGLECLEASGEAEATRRAHAVYYLRLSEEAKQHLFGSQQVRWLDRLERELDNLRVALRWCLTCEERERALRLAKALWPFWWWHGHLREGRTVLTRALDTTETIPASIQAKLLAGAGLLTFVLGEQAQAEALCAESLALFREVEDPHGMVIPLLVQGFLASQIKSNFEAARRLGEEALALSRQVAFPWGIAAALRLLGLVAAREGQYTVARTLGEECLVVSRKVGNTRAIADALYLLGEGTTAEGDLVRGRSLLTESLALYKEVGDERSMAQVLATLGVVAVFQGEYAKGYALLEESLEYAGNVGERLVLVMGRIAQAIAACGQGDYAAARELLEECLRILEQWNDAPKGFLALYLMGLGIVVSAQGEPAGAARLWGAAESPRATPELPMPPVVHSTYERAVTAARTQLGEQAFAAAWAEGRTMTPEQALAAWNRRKRQNREPDWALRSGSG